MNRHTLIRGIASAVFCDNGSKISCRDIASALDADRGAEFRDPTLGDVLLLVQGGDYNGQPPPALRALHPSLDALLTRKMT